MRNLLLLGASLATLLLPTSALDIISPTPGSGVDPKKPFSILWAVDYSDPALIDIKFSGSDGDVTLATGVASYTGSYTVPEDTIKDIGTDYQVLIISDGKTIASSTGLTLGQSSNEVTTDANGQATMASTAAGSGAATSTDASSNSATITNSVLTASVESVGITTMSGTATEDGATASSTNSRSSGFVTSTLSSSSDSSGQSSASATSAQSTNTAGNRLVGELALGAAGVLAGLVALLA